MNLNFSLLLNKIEPQPFEKRFDQNLEGLRGIAAVSVMFNHAFATTILDHYEFPIWLKSIPVGSIFVFIFFILSGYVIGLSYHTIDKFSTKEFFVKRLVRLYPIYIITFLILFLTPYKFSPINFFVNIAMLQNSSVSTSNFSVIHYIDPIWSLNYEALFYLMFPLIMLIRPKVVYLFLCWLTIVCTALVLKVPILSSYVFGHIFWIAGLTIAWKLKRKEKQVNIISYLFLIVSYWLYLPADLILSFFHLIDLPGDLGAKNLSFLPLCVLIMCNVTGRMLPYEKIIKILVYGIPLIILSIIILRSPSDLWLNGRWLSGTVCLILSLITISETKISHKLLEKFARTGQISYALYLFHVPLGFIVWRFFPLEGTLTAYLCKLIIWLLLTFSLSYLAELKLQPWLAKRLKKKLL